MALAEYEIAVLKHLDAPSEDGGIKPGAALWAAAESLKDGGYIARGVLTAKGRQALKEQP